MTTLYLAPIRGITDDLYRKAFAEHFGGIDLAIAPYITTLKKDYLKSAHFKHLTAEQNREMKVIPQILGNDVDEMITLCHELALMGYTKVNWNIGCPYPMVTKRKAGSGMLPFPEMIDNVLEKLCSSQPLKVSVKTRTGLLSHDEIGAVIPVLNSYPLEEVTIHARTGKQMYKGKASVEMFKTCLDALTHKVVYNGDITSREQLQLLQQTFPEVDSWMLGRGVLMNPFLAREIKDGVVIADDEKIRTIRLFHDQLYQDYTNRLSGGSHILDKMKGHWFYLYHALNNGKKLYKKITKVKGIENYQEIVHTFLTSC